MTALDSSTHPPESAGRHVLEVRGLTAAYGAVKVLRGIDLHVGEGEVVVVLGANGAGKTTTLRAICNMPIVSRSGEIEMYGHDLSGAATSDLVRKGLSHVPQGRGTFTELTVEDNLEAGAFIRNRKDAGDVRSDIDRWFSVFPRLGERRRQIAGSLSGGEQQMLAIARADGAAQAAAPRRAVARPRTDRRAEPVRHARQPQPGRRADHAHRRTKRQPRARHRP
ncbi:MAG: hypothetical protein NVS3B12_02640 [Acidimicrobiales bacterium]